MDFLLVKAVILVDCLLILATLLLLLYSNPIAGIFAVLAGTCFLNFQSDLPLTSVGSVHIPDIILLILFFMLFVRSQQSSRYRIIKGPLDKPLIIFAVIGLAKLLTTNNDGLSDFFEGVREFKVIGYYLLAILVANFARDEREVKHLVCGCLLLACITSAVVIARAFIVPPSSMDTSADIFYAQEFMAGGSANILIYWSFCTLFSLLLIRGINVKYMVGCGIYLVYFMLMYHRHMYIGIPFAVGIICMFIIRRYKSTFFMMILMSLLIICVVSFAYMLGPRVLRKHIELTGERLVSVKTIKDSSTVEYRQIENRYAMEAITQRPIFGIGFNRSYRPPLYGPDDKIDWFLHNGYLWIMLKMGISGCIPFIWFSFIFVKRGLKNWKKINDKFLKSVVLGSTISYLGLGLINLVVAYFMQDWGVAIFGLMFGVNESIYRLNDRVGRNNNQISRLEALPLAG